MEYYRSFDALVKTLNDNHAWSPATTTKTGHRPQRPRHRRCNDQAKHPRKRACRGVHPQHRQQAFREPEIKPGRQLHKGNQSVAAHTGLSCGAILLDSKSTCSIFCDASLLSDIQSTNPPLVLNTNGSPHMASQTSAYHGLGSPRTVWFNPQSLANVLALRDVR